MAKDRQVGRKELDEDQNKQNTAHDDQYADKQFVKEDMVRQDVQSDERYAEQEHRSDDQDEAATEQQRVSDERYAELQAKYRRLRVVCAVVVLVVMIGVGMVGKYVKDTRDLTDGVADGTCALIGVTESSADTNKSLIAAIHRAPHPLSDLQKETLDTRQRSRERNEILAKRLRASVSCPPRVRDPSLKTNKAQTKPKVRPSVTTKAKANKTTSKQKTKTTPTPTTPKSPDPTPTPAPPLGGAGASSGSETSSSAPTPTTTTQTGLGLNACIGPIRIGTCP